MLLGGKKTRASWQVHTGKCCFRLRDVSWGDSVGRQENSCKLASPHREKLLQIGDVNCGGAVRSQENSRKLASPHREVLLQVGNVSWGDAVDHHGGK